MAVQWGNMAAVVGSLRGSLDWGVEGFGQTVTIITFSYLVKLVAVIYNSTVLDIYST